MIIDHGRTLENLYSIVYGCENPVWANKSPKRIKKILTMVAGLKTNSD